MLPSNKLKEVRDSFSVRTPRLFRHRLVDKWSRSPQVKSTGRLAIIIRLQSCQIIRHPLKSLFSKTVLRARTPEIMAQVAV
jgi:hypothetical protein